MLLLLAGLGFAYSGAKPQQRRIRANQTGTHLQSHTFSAFIENEFEDALRRAFGQMIDTYTPADGSRRSTTSQRSKPVSALGKVPVHC